MDFESHRILAENAYKKAVQMYEENNPEQYRDMLHFAHVARLHFAFTSKDPTDERMLEGIEKSDELLIKVYELLDLEKAAAFIQKHK